MKTYRLHEEGYVDEIRPFTPDYGETSFTDVTSVDRLAAQHEHRTPDDTKLALLSNELKRGKIEELYATLGVKGDSRLVDLDRFKIAQNPKTKINTLSFWNDTDWVRLTDKRTGEFLVESTLRNKIGGLNAMKRLLGFEDTPLKSQQSIDAARKLASTIPTELQMEVMELNEIVPTTEAVQKELQAASTNTDLDMREFLGIDKALQCAKGEFAKKTHRDHRDYKQRAE